MATRAEVAKLAGVSASTVSYALSGDRSIKEETRKRVLKAVAQLNYRPNFAAGAWGTRMDGWMIRTAAIQRGVPCITTIAGFKAAVAGISELQGKSFSICSIQDWLAIVE